MLAALIGFGSFVAAVLLMCLFVYWKADLLESWARRHVVRSS